MSLKENNTNRMEKSKRINSYTINKNTFPISIGPIPVSYIKYCINQKSQTKNTLKGNQIKIRLNIIAHLLY